jgi:hypothetical protein
MGVYYMVTGPGSRSEGRPRGPEEGQAMRMPWIVLVGGLFLAALGLSLLPPCSGPLLAQSGCCKTRQPNGPWSKRPELTFAECRDLNQEQDRDNVFEPTGRVWWDRECK